MPPRLRTIIDENAALVIERWEAVAIRTTGAESLTRTELVGRIPALLATLVLPEVETPSQADSMRQRWLIDSHLAARLRQGFELPEMVEEFLLLGRCVESIWAGKPVAERPDPAEVVQLHRELRRATGAAAALFAENLIQYQQQEKRFLRRLQKVATDARADEGTAPSRARLHEMLEVVSDALKADTSGLYFSEAENRQLRLVASTGNGAPGEEYVMPLGVASFASRFADSQRTFFLADIAKSGLEVPVPLRQTGTQAILAMPLLSKGVMFGALYVGMRVVRLFEPREVRMFESLGERLGLLLNDARANGALLASNQELRTERELRERFVAVLAHDLLGPLVAAKMGMQLLVSHPELLVERSSVAMRVIRDIDRTDAMVRDLLDVHQIRAGHRLSLRLGKTDLVAVARDVVQDLKVLHGDRFVVTSAEQEWGFWSAHDMRRALWNLVSNAVKYGRDGTSIGIRIVESGGTVELSVHNEGPVIDAGEHATLFDPFSRAVSVQAAAQRGWGLGLTLVKGCAEAHGGTVAIESDPEKGTTFTLRFPVDARPHQPSATA